MNRFISRASLFLYASMVLYTQPAFSGDNEEITTNDCKRTVFELAECEVENNSKKKKIETKYKTMNEVLEWVKESKKNEKYQTEILKNISYIEEDLYFLIKMHDWKNLEKIIQKDSLLLLNYCIWADEGVDRKWLKSSEIINVPDLINFDKKDSNQQLALFLFYRSINDELAISHLREAVKDDKNSLAQARMGWVSEGGYHGIKKSGTEAKAFYKKAITLGNTIAIFNMARIYHMGNEDVKQNLKKARELCEQGIEVGYPGSLYILGKLYFIDTDFKDYEKGRKLFEQAAKFGVANAMYILGSMYYIGEGVEKNLIKSFEWYRKAADLGHVTAMYRTFQNYYKGEGVTQDLIQTTEWFHKAVTLKPNENSVRVFNDILVQCLRHGNNYFTGNGVNVDHHTACKYYQVVAEKATNLNLKNQAIRQLVAIMNGSFDEDLQLKCAGFLRKNCPQNSDIFKMANDKWRKLLKQYTEMN